jgi:hypothetical protein
MVSVPSTHTSMVASVGVHASLGPAQRADGPGAEHDFPSPICAQSILDVRSPSGDRVVQVVTTGPSHACA